MATIPHTEENVQKIRKVADELLGTCGDIDTALQSEFGEDVEMADVDIKLLEELDEVTMVCNVCGWWCETGFLSDDLVCDECSEDEDE